MPEVKLNFYQTIIYFGVLNTIVLSILLVFFSKNRRASRWLGLLLFSVAFNLFDMEVTSYLFRNVSWYYLNGIPLEYTTCFLYLFYVKSLLDPQFKIRGKYAWWLVPFAVVCVYQILRMWYVAYQIPLAEKVNYAYIQIEFLIKEGPAILLALASYAVSYLSLQKYQRKIKRNFSNIEKTSLNWLRFLTIAAFSTGAIHLVYYLVEWSIYPNYLSFIPYFPFWIYVVGVLLTIGYKNLLQPELLTELNKLAPQIKKYKTSALGEHDIQRISQQLINLMQNEKLYRIHDLSLVQISERMGVPPHQVSQTINQGLDTSFYDFVNSYRVEEVKEKITSPQYLHLTLSALALEVGFNSKNSFNRAFRKITQQSPSQYRKSHQL